MDRKDYMKNYNKMYKQSYAGFIKYVYAHQIRNAKQRKHTLPEYTENELLNWYITNATAIKLHEEWIAANCNKELTPSIDRLDNSKTYSFDNIEVVTWKENKKRAYKQISNGTLFNSSLLHQLHPIVQYNLYGIKVASYISIAEAVKATGIDHRGISSACKKQRATFHGFLWRYASEEIDLLLLTEKELNSLRYLAIASKGFSVKITTESNTFTCSVKEAAEYLNISEHNVRQIIKNKISTKTPTLPAHISITKECNV